MAIVKYIYTIEDSDGDQSNCIFRVPKADVPLLTDIQTFGNVLTAHLWPIIDGIIVGLKTEIDLTVSVVGAHPVADNTEVEIGASWSLVNSAGVRDTLYIPTFSKAKMSQGNVVLTDADVAAFVIDLTTGAGGVEPCDANELDITAVARAFETSRKRKR